MGCGASAAKRNQDLVALYGAQAVGKVGLSGSQATEVRQALRRCRLFQSVSEQILTDLVKKQCGATHPRAHHTAHTLHTPQTTPRARAHTQSHTPLRSLVHTPPQRSMTQVPGDTRVVG